jgi:hypothetical protein
MTCVNDTSCLVWNARCQPGTLPTPANMDFFPANDLQGCICDPWAAWQGATCNRISNITVGLAILWFIVSALSCIAALLAAIDFALLVTAHPNFKPNMDVLFVTQVLVTLALVFHATWTLACGLQVMSVNSVQVTPTHRTQALVKFYESSLILAVFFTLLASLNLIMSFVQIFHAELTYAYAPYRVSRAFVLVLILQVVFVLLIIGFSAINFNLDAATAVGAVFSFICLFLLYYALYRFASMARNSPLAKFCAKYALALCLAVTGLCSCLIISALYLNQPMSVGSWAGRPSEFAQIAFQYFTMVFLALIVLFDHAAIAKKRQLLLVLKRRSSDVAAAAVPSPTQTVQLV